MSKGSVQVRLDVTQIRNGVVRFGSGDLTEFCAVMELVSSQQSLPAADDAKYVAGGVLHSEGEPA